MNLTLQIVLAIAGCIALLTGLFGGGVKAKEVAIPKLSFSARFFSSLIGVALIGTAIWLPTKEPPPEPTLSPSVEPEPAATESQGGDVTPLLPLPTSAPTDPPINPSTDTPADTPTIPTPTSEFASPGKWSDVFCLENEICTTADVDGDAQSDLVAFLRDTQPEPGRYDVYVGLSTGYGFASPAKWSDFFCLERELCTTADADGDGKSDLIAFLRDSQPEPGRYDVYVSLSTGREFASPVKWSDFFCLEQELCTTADADGDGKADLIAFVRDTQAEPGRYDVYVGLSNGNAFAQPSKWSGFFCLENESCIAADVDGDGTADLIAFGRGTQAGTGRYGVYVSLSTGHNFGSPIKWSDSFCLENEDCTAADVNGDSRADLISFLRDSQPEPGRYDVYVSLKNR